MKTYRLVEEYGDAFEGASMEEVLKKAIDDGGFEDDFKDILADELGIEWNELDEETYQRERDRIVRSFLEKSKNFKSGDVLFSYWEVVIGETPEELLASWEKYELGMYEEHEEEETIGSVWEWYLVDEGDAPEKMRRDKTFLDVVIEAYEHGMDGVIEMLGLNEKEDGYTIRRVLQETERRLGVFHNDWLAVLMKEYRKPLSALPQTCLSQMLQTSSSGRNRQNPQASPLTEACDLE